MPVILSGKEVADALKIKLKAETEQLIAAGIVPKIATVRVGERGDDIAYERSAKLKCRGIGIAVKNYVLEESASQEELIALIQKLNADRKTHGVLLFLPLPKQFDEKAVKAALYPEKDIDGITEASMGGLYSGSKTGFAPCTAQACMEILSYYGIDPAGKNAVVLGRSLVIGKPVSMLLLEKNATVTVCHSKTRDVREMCRRADIIVACTGRAKVVDESYLSEGQVIVDVGINVTESGICGDVDFAAVCDRAAAITPVPGGVGSVTTSILASHVIEAARRSAL